MLCIFCKNSLITFRMTHVYEILQSLFFSSYLKCSANLTINFSENCLKFLLNFSIIYHKFIVKIVLNFFKNILILYNFSFPQSCPN